MKRAGDMDAIALNTGGPRRPSLTAMAPSWLLTSDQGVTHPSNLVSAWDDQTTNASNASQATGANQFAYASTGGPTGQPLITGSATKYMLVPDSASLRPAGAFTLFVVARRTGTTPFQCLINPSNTTAWTNGWFGLVTGADGTTFRAFVGRYDTMAVTWASDTAWHVHELVYTPPTPPETNGTLEYLVDGVSKGTVAALPSAGGPVVLGGGIASTTPTYAFPWQGNMDTFALYASPTVTGRSLVRRACGARVARSVTA